MNKAFLISVFTFFILLSCNKQKRNPEPSFTDVETDTLLNDSISIRALLTDGYRVWYAGSSGRYGWVPLSKGEGFVGIVANDTVFPEFRAIAQTKNDIFILNAGSPANLYKISKNGKYTEKVYTETGDKVFYDSMHFFNDTEGIAMGDPVNNCLSVIKTTDGGTTWKKIECSNLPKVAEGEAGFAASNTNIVIKKDKAWIVSGGKKSRVYYSDDKGNSWVVYDTPIVQGGEMTGIFGADFYDEKLGFAVGGDYSQPEKKSGNKIFTKDGGKTWKLIAENEGFGYASCVQFIPGSDGYELMSAGPSGIFYSYDAGKNWKQIVADKNYHTLKFVDSKTVIAAGNGKIIKLRLE